MTHECEFMIIPWTIELARVFGQKRKFDLLLNNDASRKSIS